MDLRVISIGALAAHPLWGERDAARTGHATTTLIRTDSKAILVDPGLPEPALVARLGERANLAPGAVTDVFLTSVQPDTWRAIGAFRDASWWVSEAERETVGVTMARRLKDLAHESPDDPVRRGLEQGVAMLARCRVAPDSLGKNVDLFPLPGVTPGLCGLIVSEPRRTTVVCGDAIPTIEHLDQGKIAQDAVDVQRAKQSFADAVEIADVLVLGRDNLVINPARRTF